MIPIILPVYSFVPGGARKDLWGPGLDFLGILEYIKGE